MMALRYADGPSIVVLMLKQKLLATFLWSAACVAGAMIVDYVITILLLRDIQGYTPLITLCIAAFVSIPTTYVLVSGKINLLRARDELAVARDTAVNANLSKTLFFANMSHELRTPLNAIIGFSQLLETDIFAAKRVEYAQLILESGRHLLELVDDLLNISKIEAGQLHLDTTQLLLGDIVEQCCAIVDPRVRTARLRLVRKIESDLPTVLGDQRALKQILLNLLTNAIKFSEPGGLIEVFGHLLPSGEIVFGVRDQGIGISPEDQARVFERYGQARHETTRGQEGTGLGLPIVKGLAEAHGGHVSLESEPGTGTRVTIWLPASRVGRKQHRALAS